jgi:hypothetical protein
LTQQKVPHTPDTGRHRATHTILLFTTSTQNVDRHAEQARGATRRDFRAAAVGAWSMLVAMGPYSIVHSALCTCARRCMAWPRHVTTHVFQCLDTWVASVHSHVRLSIGHIPHTGAQVGRHPRFPCAHMAPKRNTPANQRLENIRTLRQAAQVQLKNLRKELKKARSPGDTARCCPCTGVHGTSDARVMLTH